jgi:hypothetical protein
VSGALALAALLASLIEVGFFPPQVEQRHLQTGAAATNVFVDSPPRYSPVTPTGFETASKRANLIGNVMASPRVLDRVASMLDIDANQIAATTEITESVPAVLKEPDNERRANEILLSRAPYRLDIQARPTVPILDIYAEAPTADAAKRLAEASIQAGGSYLRDVAARRGSGSADAVRLTKLGSARSGVLDPTAPAMIAGLTFLVVFSTSFGLLMLADELRRGWLRAGRIPNRLQSESGSDETSPDLSKRQAGDWPYTTRLLPWMVALFIAALWLVPINAIQVQASLPVDLKLDRIILPIILAIWVVALALGGRDAPTWRFTPIHAAIAAFAAVAGLSVVLNAGDLNQTLELGLAIKKLALLAAYLSLFLVVATVVRGTEVRAFLTFTLVMAVVCAVGILWEYRTGSNLFYAWSAKLSPGFLQVSPVDATAIDEIGRPAVIGPADLGLEAVGMLSMALPIALVRLMHSTAWRARLLYGLAACLILGAALSTYRKSALLAPLSAFLVLGYFRRRELLRLAPLGAVVLVGIPVLAPNALGSVVDQFQPGSLGVSTVSDRVADYDAIRPDVLSHPLFGRGFGSYEHTSYRILDSDVLTRLVESGLVGLISFLLVMVTVVAVAAPVIRSRNPSRAPPALAIAASATAFLVLCALFDVLSFPHVPYLFLTMAGLLAVIARRDSSEAVDPRSRRDTAGEADEDEVTEAPDAPLPRLPTPA